MAEAPDDRWAEVDAALDAWLRCRLRDLLDVAAAEPVPSDLLRLISECHAGPLGPPDGPACCHRDARIECMPGSQLCRLVLRGHPPNGVPLGPAGAVAALVDRWLDEARLPDALPAARKVPL